MRQGGLILAAGRVRSKKKTRKEPGTIPVHGPRRVKCVVLCHSFLVAGFDAKAVYRPRMLGGEMSQCFGVSLWRESSLRAAHVGGSDVTVFWWLALASRQFMNRVFGGLLWRVGSLRAASVSGATSQTAGGVALSCLQFRGRVC